MRKTLAPIFTCLLLLFLVACSEDNLGKLNGKWVVDTPQTLRMMDLDPDGIKDFKLTIPDNESGNESNALAEIMKGLIVMTLDAMVITVEGLVVNMLDAMRLDIDVPNKKITMSMGARTSTATFTVVSSKENIITLQDETGTQHNFTFIDDNTVVHDSGKENNQIVFKRAQ